jgi:enamine deaminase RidA (YjgF/YER057c/UK114 family)
VLKGKEQTMNQSLHESLQEQVITPDSGSAQMQFISARRGGSDELSILEDVLPRSGKTAAQIVFGGNIYYESARERLSGLDWPLLWLQGDVCPGTQISGAQAFVVDEATVRYIKLDGRIVGSYWEDDDADYSLLAGILPVSFDATPGGQAYSSFEQIETALSKVGMDFSHVVRTWLYLDKLLDWYDEFNVARTNFFLSRGVFDRLIPASTGIGASNPYGAALASGVLAIRPKHDQIQIREVASPLQCAATEYRSSFSRAVEVTFPEHRYLTISGTASIAPSGESLYQGDVVKQIHLTLDVVQAILKSRGYEWADTVRAIAYFRDINDLPAFDAILKERGIAPLPLAPAHTIVCRDDLLFEIELDAMKNLLDKAVVYA